MAGSATSIFGNYNTPSTTGIIPSATANPVNQSYNLYNTAVKQQAGDYDKIMAQYQALAKGAQTQNSALTFSPIQAAQYNYAPTQDYKNSTANLASLAATGGYSDADKNELRARGISPIRAVYAGAQRDIDRNRTLQGGFSPNYTATKAKMARELSDEIAGQVTNVNAGIAQNVAQNKINIAPTYASATGNENALRAGIGQSNTAAQNSVNEFNSSEPLAYANYNLNRTSGALGAINGQTSLYGTTPALSNLFGNQAVTAAQLQNMIAQQGQQNTINTARIIR